MNKENIYLNWGTLSKTWPSVMAAVHRHQNEYEINPTISLFEGWGKFWQLQQKVAHFFGAQPEDFYFRPNVTVAMNDFILGAELPAGDIVVSNLEYGSIVNICKLRAERDGRSLIIIKIPLGSEADSQKALTELIMSQVPKTAALLMLSHIMTGTGLKIPLKMLAAETRARGILLASDGAHGPGATELDFRELQNVDFYGGNLHKWFRGPKGCGFGWAPARNHAIIKPIMGSWTVFETPAPFKPFGNGNRWNLSMLMSYCLNFGSFYALAEAVDEWNARGTANVLEQLRKKRLLLETEMSRQLGWEILSPACKDLQSPMVTFALPEKFAALGYEILHALHREQNVTVSVAPLLSSFALRLSAHVDVTDEQIIEGVGRIKKYFDQKLKV